MSSDTQGAGRRPRRGLGLAHNISPHLTPPPLPASPRRRGRGRSFFKGKAPHGCRGPPPQGPGHPPAGARSRRAPLAGAWRHSPSPPPAPSLPCCPQSNPRRARCARFPAATAPCTSCATTTRWVLASCTRRQGPQRQGRQGRRDRPAGRPPLLLTCSPPPALAPQRYKICPYHLELPCLVVEGQTIRFCQQCGRFQLLSDFEGDRRSCRRKVRSAAAVDSAMHAPCNRLQRVQHGGSVAQLHRRACLQQWYPNSAIPPEFATAQAPSHLLAPPPSRSWTSTTSGGARRRRSRRRG